MPLCGMRGLALHDGQGARVGEKKAPTLFSGIQPSGRLMIGNYIGAIRNWVALQDACDCLFCLVDLHAITVPQEPSELLERSYEFLALYLACGVDPDRSTVFIQSHVPAHAELTWVLNCHVGMGELSRMTQFKDRLQQGKPASVGLFDYPVLMAADILLYDTNLVPVGADQTQHLELARDIAVRFNSRFGETFAIPEIYLPRIGARVMSLADPTSKMSKSDANPNSYIALLDPPDVVRKKVRSAVTDSGREVRFDEARPAISNLMTIYAAVTGRDYAGIEADFAGKGYGELKAALAEAVVEFLRPIQERYAVFAADRDQLSRILAAGASRARARADTKLAQAHRAVGFIPRA